MINLIPVVLIDLSFRIRIRYKKKFSRVNVVSKLILTGIFSKKKMIANRKAVIEIDFTINRYCVQFSDISPVWNVISCSRPRLTGIYWKTGYEITDDLDSTQRFLHQVKLNVIIFFESCQNFNSKVKSENFGIHNSYLYRPLFKIFFKAIGLTLAARTGMRIFVWLWEAESISTRKNIK